MLALLSILSFKRPMRTAVAVVAISAAVAVLPVVNRNKLTELAIEPAKRRSSCLS